MNINPASINQVKSWKKLQLSKYRRRESLFLAEGLRCVEQIIENGVIAIDALLIDDSFSLPADFPDSDIPAYSLSPNDFAAVTDTDTPQGIAAVCHTPKASDLSHFIETRSIIAGFDAIQDPGNLGTMIRTASWFGAGGLLIGNGTVDPFHPKVVRSTAGATGTIPYIKGDLSEMLTEFNNSGKEIFLLDGGETSEALRGFNPGEGRILIAGNEGNGVSPSLFKEGRRAVRIDGHPERVESLNAAVALSIGLYHLTGM
ncbi:MAG: RNA methyltransferase [Balneolaceae bacterium]|nr:RNA methyltransferase [Balneolaceae bacterium]MCH8548795.1 RNA methyltransferase [Balneolaceae bacterium]